MIYFVSVSEAAYQAKNLLELKAAEWQSATGVMAHIAMVSAWDHSRRKQVGFPWWEKRFCWIFLCLSLIEYSSSSFYSTQRSSEILFRAYTSYFFLILDFLCHSRCCQTSRHAWSIIPPKVAFGDSIGSCGQEDDESAEVAMNAWLARVPRLELDEHQCLGSLDACEGWRFDGISSTFSDPNHDPKPGSGFSLLHLLPEWSLEAHW